MNIFNIILIFIIISILILILLLLKYNLCNSSTSRNIIEKFDDDIDEEPPVESLLGAINPDNKPMNTEIDNKLSNIQSNLYVDFAYLNKYTILYQKAFNTYTNDTTNNAQIYNSYINAKTNFEEKQKKFNNSLNTAINDTDASYWLRVLYQKY